MKYIYLIRPVIFILLAFNYRLLCQSSEVAPKQNPFPIQVTVSGNHPDAIDNKSTVIFDNMKNVDRRSYERPIKNDIPPSDTEEELFLPNEVIPILPVEEVSLKNLPDAEPIDMQERNNESNDMINRYRNDNLSVYEGTRQQNLKLMKALNIIKGWSRNQKWSDGTIVDEHSIVDWIRFGEGERLGINKDASMEKREYLYNKYILGFDLQ